MQTAIQPSLFDYVPPKPFQWRRVVLALFVFVLVVSPLSVYRSAPVVNPSHESPVKEDLPPISEEPLVPTVQKSIRPVSDVGFGQYDDLNLTDVERTYEQVVWLLGRPPTMEELLYMTISAEYWIYTQSEIGQEAVARNYYHFCGKDGCSQEELFRFLSGYQPWFGRNARTDSRENINELAEKMYNLMVNKFNYDHADGPGLKVQAKNILNQNYAAGKGWTSGIRDNRPRQWVTVDASKIGDKRGYGGNDDAISCIKVGGGMFFCFFTYEQERNLIL